MGNIMKTKKYRRNVRRLTKKHKSKHRSKKVGGADQADQTNQTNPSTPERQPTHTGPGGPVKRTPDPHAEELRKERERKEKAFMEALENKRQIEKYNDELTKLVISSSDQHTEPPSSIHDVVMPENPSQTNPTTPERRPTLTGPGGPVKRTPDPHAEELK